MKKLLFICSILSSMHSLGMLQKSCAPSKKDFTGVWDGLAGRYQTIFTHSECVICLENIENKHCFMCHDQQVVCKKCAHALEKCPFCDKGKANNQEVGDCFSQFQELKFRALEQKECPLCLDCFRGKGSSAKEWNILSCCRQYACQDCINQLEEYRNPLRCPQCQSDHVRVCRVVWDSNGKEQSEKGAETSLELKNSQTILHDCQGSSTVTAQQLQLKSAKKDQKEEIVSHNSDINQNSVTFISDRGEEVVVDTVMSSQKPCGGCGNDDCRYCVNVCQQQKLIHKEKVEQQKVEVTHKLVNACATLPKHRDKVVDLGYVSQKSALNKAKRQQDEFSNSDSDSYSDSDSDLNSVAPIISGSYGSRQKQVTKKYNNIVVSVDGDGYDKLYQQKFENYF